MSKVQKDEILSDIFGNKGIVDNLSFEEFNSRTKTAYEKWEKDYGTDVMKTSGYDCATIPGAVKNTNDMKVVAERICGRQFVVTHEGTGAKATTICSEFTFFE